MILASNLVQGLMDVMNKLQCSSEMQWQKCCCMNCGCCKNKIRFCKVWFLAHKNNCIYSGLCIFGIVSIEMVSNQNRVHSGKCPFGIVSIRDRVRLGSFPFGIVYRIQVAQLSFLYNV